MTNQIKLPTDTFCILPWIHLSTRVSGQVRVCCTANSSSVGPTNDRVHGGQVGILKNNNGKPSSLNNDALLDIWNNDYMKNVRLQMLNNEKPNSCLKCYKEEDSGVQSKRIWETRDWMKSIDVDELIKNTSEDGSVPPKLYYVDLRLGSKCNLRCSICSPNDSSDWVPEWNNIFPKVENPTLKQTMMWEKKDTDFNGAYNWYKNNPTFWSDLYAQIPHMKQLYFAGGEPLIIDEHYELLREVIKRGYAKNIVVRYNSNGTVIPDELFELWSHFKKVRFHFSMDSIGDMNTYIRYPNDWETNVKHLHIMDNSPDNVEVTIACTLNMLNMYYIPDFVKWKLNQNFKKINCWPFGAGTINAHFLGHPPHLAVKVFPEEFKNKIEEKYNDFYKWLDDNWKLCIGNQNVDYDTWKQSGYGEKRFRNTIKFMKSEDWSVRMPEFREFIKLLDDSRGTDFRKTFPEMAELLD